MAVSASREVQHQRVEEPLQQEQGCWAVFGRCVQVVRKSIFGERPAIHQIFDRIAADCVEQLERQTEECDQHQAIVKWLIRSSNAIGSQFNGFVDRREALHELLEEQLPKFIPHSKYAQTVLRDFKAYWPKALSDIILSDARHLNCECCKLAEQREQEALKVQEKTAELFYKICFPDREYERGLRRSYRFGIGGVYE